jgi:hypothetical protein
VRDLTLRLPDRSDALAELGEALGRAGVSIDGGGAFGHTAHFLVADAVAAIAALAAAGIAVAADREVVVLRLDQETPGQLGAVCRRMADAGVRIEVLYSDHANQLIFVVDDVDRGRAVARAWTARRRPE